VLETRAATRAPMGSVRAGFTLIAPLQTPRSPLKGTTCFDYKPQGGRLCASARCSIVAPVALSIERLSTCGVARVAPPSACSTEVISVTRAHLPAPTVVSKLADNSAGARHGSRVRAAAVVRRSTSRINETAAAVRFRVCWAALRCTARAFPEHARHESLGGALAAGLLWAPLSA